MQAVAALYKSNPEYFIYYKIRSAINNYNKKLLYKGFPETKESKIFDSFTKKSFQEIYDNIQTPKYPILFISYVDYRMFNSKVTKEEFSNFLCILSQIGKNGVSVKESGIASYIVNRGEFILKMKSIMEQNN